MDVLGEDFNEGQVVHWIQEYTWATRVLVAVIRVKKCHHGKPGHMVGTSNPSCIVHNMADDCGGHGASLHRRGSSHHRLHGKRGRLGVLLPRAGRWTLTWRTADLAPKSDAKRAKTLRNQMTELGPQQEQLPQWLKWTQTWRTAFGP